MKTEPFDGKATQSRSHIPGRDQSYIYKSLRLKNPGNKNHKLRHLGHPHISVHLSNTCQLRLLFYLNTRRQRDFQGISENNGDLEILKIPSSWANAPMIIHFLKHKAAKILLKLQ